MTCLLKECLKARRVSDPIFPSVTVASSDLFIYVATTWKRAEPDSREQEAVSKAFQESIYQIALRTPSTLRSPSMLWCCRGPIERDGVQRAHAHVRAPAAWELGSPGQQRKLAWDPSSQGDMSPPDSDVLLRYQVLWLQRQSGHSSCPKGAKVVEGKMCRLMSHKVTKIWTGVCIECCRQGESGWSVRGQCRSTTLVGSAPEL